MGKLDGLRILLTGASRGVGLETVKLFCLEGAQVLGIARDAAKLAALKQAHAGFEFLQGDVADKALPAKAAAAAQARWGALDLLINNAALQQWNEGFHAEPAEVLESIFQANVFGPHRLIQALLPLLEKGKSPRIINVSSGAGTLRSLKSDFSMPNYRLSKFALNGLTLLHAGDLKGRVDINCLDPGWLKTDMGGSSAPGEPKDGAQRMLELALMPPGSSGGFYYGNKPIDF
jgi:NAD(P)-dependent dehydrogenase (short-subunit alcohol dehydrogenase family)